MGVKSLLARISAGELEYESCSLHRTFSEICTAQIWTFPGGLGASEGTWEHVNALKFKIRKLQPYSSSLATFFSKALTRMRVKIPYLMPVLSLIHSVETSHT